MKSVICAAAEANKFAVDNISKEAKSLRKCRYVNGEGNKFNDKHLKPTGRFEKFPTADKIA